MSITSSGKRLFCNYITITCGQQFATGLRSTDRPTDRPTDRSFENSQELELRRPDDLSVPQNRKPGRGYYFWGEKEREKEEETADGVVYPLILFKERVAW